MDRLASTSKCIKIDRLALGLENCSFKPKLLWVFFNYSIVQSPWHMIKLFWCAMYSSVAMMFGLRDPTDSDIIAYVEGTTLSMLITKDKTNQDLYSLVVNTCLLELTTGPLESFKMTYSKRKSTILSFELNGKEMHTRELIMSVLFAYHTTSLHTKCHLFSNSLTNYIIDNEIEILEPSTLSSIPLHQGLLFSTMSAVTEQRGWYYESVGQFYTHPAKRPSVLEESNNFSAMEHHKALASKIDPCRIKYLDYLVASHRVIGEVLQNHNLPKQLVEPLFNHTIVHSTDHINTHDLGFFR